MTNIMSENTTDKDEQQAPERFWIAPQKNGRFTDTFRVSQYSAFDGATEYIRADLARSRASRAAVEGDALAAMFDELYNCYTASKCAAGGRGEREEYLRLKGMAEAYQDAAKRCREFPARRRNDGTFAAASSPLPAEELPFDDYCAGAGDCRACKGINCTCPHHAPAAEPESLYATCRRVWVCKRCGNCLDHCRHQDESNFHEDLTMPCSVKTPAEPPQDDGWVTFGRVKVDIKNETETFERIATHYFVPTETPDKCGVEGCNLNALAHPETPKHNAPAEPEGEQSFQNRVQPWMLACFDAEIAGDKEERNHRFLEEALELVQSCGATRSEAHQLVDYTFNRPADPPEREVGGVMVTLAALCLAQGFDMYQCAEAELARIWTKIDVIRAKQAAKPKHSPLPEHATATTPPSETAVGGGVSYDQIVQAITDIEGARESHAQWASHLRLPHTFECQGCIDHAAHIGDADYHDEWIIKYDNAIYVLAHASIAPVHAAGDDAALVLLDKFVLRVSLELRDNDPRLLSHPAWKGLIDEANALLKDRPQGINVLTRSESRK